MKRWLTLGLLVLSLPAPGCALMGRSLEESPSRPPEEAGSRPIGLLAPLVQRQAAKKLEPLPMPPELGASADKVPLATKNAEPLLMPPELGASAEKVSSAAKKLEPLPMPPELVTTAEKAPLRLPVGEPIAEQASASTASAGLSVEGPRALPRFGIAVAGTALPAKRQSAPTPTQHQAKAGTVQAAVPTQREVKAAPAEPPSIEIINHTPPLGPPETTEVTTLIKPAGSREQRGNAVRYSNYLQVKDTEEPPLSGNASPSENGALPRAAFGTASPSGVSRNIAFGLPRILPPELPADLERFEVKDAGPPAITPFVMRPPPPQPVILTAMKARMRRPHFLAAPIARAMAVASVKPVESEPAVPQEKASEIVQIAGRDLPEAIVPFVIVQLTPNDMAAVHTLESAAQILEFGALQESSPRRADLGPPVIVEP